MAAVDTGITPAAQAPSSPPCHVAVIMDGNGRWARARGRPRAFGHRAGVRAAREVVKASHRHGVRHLTLFAFSQENWQRPTNEVSLLMQLFAVTLGREVQSLHRNNVRVRFIGDRTAFAAPLREQMQTAETLTAGNTALCLYIAAGYGGRWDITQAAAALVREGREITEDAVESHLSTAGVPPPDLLIRTGGERRLSNFLLWQLGYTELYFSDALWPDFDAAAYAEALAWFTHRDRRFGRVAEPV